MLIGGFTPFTLADYPGEIAAICFTQGCNFSCPFCHNKLLIPQKNTNYKAAPANQAGKVLGFLGKRRGKLNALVISGGEPTLQEDLPAFLAEVRNLGYRIKLDTNGSRPRVLEMLFERGLVDFVAMDIKAPWRKYTLLAGRKVDTKALKCSVKLILDSGTRHIFRTTLVPGLLTREDVKEIRTLLPPKTHHVVQPYVEPGRAA